MRCGGDCSNDVLMNGAMMRCGGNWSNYEMWW